MMRSMYTGISGLKAHQAKMDVIGNNIANVNTVGYKSSRVTFNEFFSQNLSSASGGSETTGRGGTNPMQVGMGVSVGSIDVNMSPGAGQRTDRAMDLMINGDGFFVVGDSNGTYFTRAGAFGLDATGTLVNTAGMKVMGWDVIPDPDNPGEYITVKDKVSPIQISGEKTYMPPETTKNIELTGNLNPLENPEQNTTMSIYDSLGNRYTMDVKLIYDDTTTPAGWTYNIGNVAYPNGDTENPITLDTSALPTLTFTDDPVPDPVEFNPMPGQIIFTTDGRVDTAATEASGFVNYFDVDPGTGLPVDATFGDAATGAGNVGQVKIDVSDLTSFEEPPSVTATALDGNKAGSLTNMSIGQDGKIYGQYSNGKTKPIAMIPIAIFPNPAGLEKVGGNLFIATANSGAFDGIGYEVGQGGGNMMGGTLEMSNVDLATEFTDMITTQRGFQANSRTITTSDEILQELVNLKR